MFALLCLRWGAFRDVASSISKYASASFFIHSINKYKM